MARTHTLRNNVECAIIYLDTNARKTEFSILTSSVAPECIQKLIWNKNDLDWDIAVLFMVFACDLLFIRANSISRLIRIWWMLILWQQSKGALTPNCRRSPNHAIVSCVLCVCACVCVWLRVISSRPVKLSKHRRRKTQTQKNIIRCIKSNLTDHEPESVDSLSFGRLYWISLPRLTLFFLHWFIHFELETMNKKMVEFY